MEAGLTVEEDLFDAEAVGLGGAGDLWVERGFGGEGADEGDDLLADLGLAGGAAALGVDGGDYGAAVGVVFGGDGVEGLGECEAAGVAGGLGVGSDEACVGGGCRAICRGLREGDGGERGGD